MKDFIDMILFEPFHDTEFIGIILGIVIWIILIGIIALIFYGLFYLVDSVGRPSYLGKGQVIDKRFVPAHTTTTYTYVNKVMVPIINHHPDSWYFSIQTQYGVGSISVNRSLYNNILKHCWVDIEYSKGRLSNSIYIKKIL